MGLDHNLPDLGSLFKNFEKHITLLDEEKKQIASHLNLIKVIKNQEIISQGCTVNQIFYVVSGALRAFHLDKKGKESTVMFAINDWWITDMNGFANQEKAQVSLVALEDAKVVSIQYSAMEELLNEIPKLERFFRILFQRAYIREQSRMLRQLSMDVATRYHSFVKKYPNIIAAISQKQMASYLGVTPEFLSQVKNK